MYPGGIPPKPLDQREWAKIKSQVGLLDLPYSSLRKLLRLLQNRGILDVNDAFSRNFVLYASLQMELHAYRLRPIHIASHARAHTHVLQRALTGRSRYRTSLSDEIQRNSGIERTLQAVDGLNFTKVLEQLCLISCGKAKSLPYAELSKSYSLDSEFIAVQTILAGVGAWAALRAHDKWGDPEQVASPHPNNPIWRRHPAAYRAGVLAMRNQRLRVLGDLRRAVAKDQPQVDLDAFLAREDHSRKLEAVVQGLRKDRESEFGIATYANPLSDKDLDES